ncbi:NEDD8-activating enzyme E1 regulatory subunit-like [Centruroides sculpturatus]|uniref:NEDD8-activating enzyme E1 regulatory subunit-like n=1 Tax=Centruroides sculpturatus TaxID=218467 RepID=UPI000C6C9323|nr:NEDD8-activating enzyme E1 regulatory subunit-like [Centruroides sculpturatus]
MVGYMRLQVTEHTVTESHPDDTLYDLRLDNPFPSLQEHVESYDFENMNKKDYSHIPYIVVILKYLELWKKEHNGQIPKGYREKDLFREIIRKG